MTQIKNPLTISGSGGVKGLEIEATAVTDVIAGEFSDVSVGDISYTTTALPNASSSVLGSVCAAIDDERVLCAYTGAVSVVNANTGVVLHSAEQTSFTITQVSKLADGVFLVSGNNSSPTSYLQVLQIDDQNNIWFGTALNLNRSFISHVVMESGKVLVAGSYTSTSSPNLFLYVASVAGTLITLGTQRSVSTTAFYNERPALAMTGTNTFVVFGKQSNSFGVLTAYFGQVSGDTVGTVSTSSFSNKVPHMSLRQDVIRSGNDYYVAASVIGIRPSNEYPYSSGAVVKITFNGSSIMAVQVMMDSFDTSTSTNYCVGFCGSPFGIISAACLVSSSSGIYFGGRLLSTVRRMSGGASYASVMKPCVIGKNAFVCSGTSDNMVLLKVSLPILVGSATGTSAVGVPSENIGVGQTGLVKVAS